jgi:type IV pilus assembly protein PilM
MGSTPSAAAPSLAGRVKKWLDAMPHPPLGIEIAESHVAALRWPQYAVEPLPPGAVVPSPVELNLADAGSVRDRLRQALAKVPARGPEVALLVPDQVVRVFLLHFEGLPRNAEEAVPLLRWRLKKSVPFDVDDTVVSYHVQPCPPGGGAGLEVLTAVVRRSVVRQYEEVVEAAGLLPGVVLGSTLSTLSYFEDERPSLLARLTGRTLTVAIVYNESLCVYRCTEMPTVAGDLAPQALLDEVYPAIAYFQDRWNENVAMVCLAGLGDRLDEFRRAVDMELGVRSTQLTPSATLDEPLTGAAKVTVDRHLDALVGWMRNRGA